jgi:hypothetical protein
MGEVIELERFRQDNEVYEERCDEVVEALLEMRDEVTLQAFNLAVAHAWKDWDEQIPVGTEIELSMMPLSECGDVRVRGLAQLRDELEAVAKLFGWDGEEG